MMNARSPLLPRPLHLRAGFVRRSYLGAIACFLGGGAALIAYPALEISEAKDTLADAEIWKTGVPAEGLNLEGHRTTHQAILDSYDLTVDYADQQGGEHHGRVKFSTLFASVDKGSPWHVRYDPKAPDRFALSWAVDLTWARWTAFGFMTFVGVGLGLMFVAGGFLVMRRLGDARQAAVQSDEAELELEGIVQITKYRRPTGQVKYRYRVPTAAGKTKVRELLLNDKKGQKPLYADAAKTRLFALRPPRAPDRPVVLRADLYPFEVPGWDAATVAAHLARQLGDK